MFAVGCKRVSQRCCTTSTQVRRRIIIASSSSQHQSLSTFTSSALPLPTKRRDEDGKLPYSPAINILPHNNSGYDNKYDNNGLHHNKLSIRQYHTSPPQQRGAAVVLTLGAIAATAKAGQYAVKGYEEWKAESAAAAAEQAELDKQQQGKDGNVNNSKAEEPSDSGATNEQNTKQQQPPPQGKRENIFASFFNLSVGSKYYEGGFEDVMTRKEAALILGVRESSAAKRIKEAHRKLLILNHPDTGGSTFLAGKINEAKELLLKGKK
mmetsp:Transcript_35440/g.60207  ORF Transcript_35440/g.60207 Transcript_35440/m.60207 type:complete len:266 (+) Transcript_35440:196-993(+)